jgi:hypothetical protein
MIIEDASLCAREHLKLMRLPVAEPGRLRSSQEVFRETVGSFIANPLIIGTSVGLSSLLK